MIEQAINQIINSENLEFTVAKEVMDEIMSGKATDAQKAAFLTALHMKGETIDEITACASVMREHCSRVNVDYDVIDIVGTGGDCAGTINISTLASLVVSAAGAKVAKHGNRAASSKCGTADLLETLGVNLNADTDVSIKALEEIGLCFLFAQKYHTAMKYVGGIRREIKIPTIFNILGPLANPAYANLQLLGVYDEKLLEPMAVVLGKLGVKRAMVVHGEDGLDEISLSAPTKVCEINNNVITKYDINPSDYGMSYCDISDLKGGDPKENAQIALDILSGKKGAKRDAVILNAAAALHIVYEISIEEGIKLASEIIDSKKALEQLNRFIQITNQKGA